MIIKSTHDTEWSAYALAVLACLMTTLVAHLWLPFIDIANIVMLFLLTVFLVALKLGRRPAIMAAFISVALFDVFCIPPRGSFAVSDVQYVVTFAVMLAVGLITAQLTAGITRQASIAELGRQQNHYLFELARDLAGAFSITQVHAALSQYLQKSGYQFELFLLNHQGQLQGIGGHPLSTLYSNMVIQEGATISVDDVLPSGRRALLIPLKAPMRIRGALAVGPISKLEGSREDSNKVDVFAQRDLLMTVASLIGIAVERLHYVEVANESSLSISSERLRSSILSALSHDLRTPLTALVGLAETLALTQENLSQSARSTAVTIHEQARAMSSLLSNLLDMARLHAGNIRLNIEWQLFEDVISASLQLLRNALQEYRIKVSLQPDFPLVEFDAILLERVVCNLIENAAKFSPKNTLIEITAYLEEEWACLSVSDEGRGFAEQHLHDKTQALFEMFVRGDTESTTPGVGLGLTICRAIIDAHHGAIVIENRVTENRKVRGACVTIKLPRGTPPDIKPEILPDIDPEMDLPDGSTLAEDRHE